jgi:hypothetical protein
MNRRRQILVNDEEKRAFQVLEEVLRHRSARLHAKVRIADALDIKNSGLTNEEYSYALKGHFDFLVEPEGEPVAFAIEFDEPYHDNNPTAQHNDKLKNSICERLELPLLRIQFEHLQQVGKYTILGWLVELWFLYQAFVEAQESGSVPLDEAFDYTMFFTSIDDEGNTEWYPFDPFHTYRNLLKELIDSGKAFSCCAIRRTNQHGSDEAISAIYLTAGGTIVGKARCRTFSFPSLSSSDLAEELAVKDVCDKYHQYIEGRYRTIPHNKVDTILRDFRQHGTFLGGFSMSRPRKGSLHQQS